MLICTVSKQQRGVLHQDKNKKLLKKETKRARGERVMGVLVPLRNQCHIEESTVSTTAST